MKPQILSNGETDQYFCAVTINGGGIDFYFNADGDITEECRWTDGNGIDEDLILSARVKAIKRIKKHLEARRDLYNHRP